jgi:hypothetical protein
MKKQEATIYKAAQVAIPDDPWRKLMISWMCTVVDVFELHREIVSIAAYFLDTSVARNLATDHVEYQLVSLTALQLAIKITETKIFPLQQLVQFSHGDFSAQDVIRMERNMFQVLDWHLHPPTPESFLEQYMGLLPVDVSESTKTRIRQVAHNLIRSSTVDDKFRRFPPSIITYAAMLVTMEKLDAGLLLWSQKQAFATNIQLNADLTNSSTGLLETYQLLWPFADEAIGSKKVLEGEWWNSPEENTCALQADSDTDVKSQIRTETAISPRNVEEENFCSVVS